MPETDLNLRIFIGMAEAAARHGFAAASVQRIAAAAGVARATFYRQFASREDCFLAAYRYYAAAIEDELGRLEALPFADRARAALEALLNAAERQPALARMMIVEAVGAGPDARAERERLFGRIALAFGPQGAVGSAPQPPNLPPRALIGGIENVIAIRLLRGEGRHLTRLLFDLLDWVDSYAFAPESATGVGHAAGLAALGGRAGAPGAAGALRPAADRPPPTVLSAPVEDEPGQRPRILAAVFRLARERGYARMTVADLVSAAGVSRRSFYRCFSGKEEAVTAAQADSLRVSATVVAAAYFSADDWRESAWAGLAALLSYIAANPDRIWLDVVESYAVGPAAVRRSFDSRLAFNLFIEPSYHHSNRAKRLPRLCSDAIGGAILELIRTEVLAGRTEAMPGILPQVSYVTIAPFLGASATLDFLAEKTSSELEGSPPFPPDYLRPTSPP